MQNILVKLAEKSVSHGVMTFHLDLYANANKVVKRTMRMTKAGGPTGPFAVDV